MFEPPFLLSASPRAGGNSDFAAGLYSRAFGQAGGTPVFLRDFPCLPCVACGACAKAAQRGMDLDPPASEGGMRFGCPLSLKDSSGFLLDGLLRARHICLVSPVYFYHLPALLKALVDRTQPFWELAQAGDKRIFSQPPRQCRVILLAAREKGEHLFEGSVRTLKYALANLNVRLAEPLLLYGLDGPGDLKNSAAKQAEIARCAEEDAKLLRALNK